MSLTIGRWINLASAIFGAAGAVILFWWTPVFGGVAPWASRSGNWMEELRATNLRLQIIQRVGFALILVSFFLQGVAQFVGP
jgi:hypothetical protein